MVQHYRDDTDTQQLDETRTLRRAEHEQETQPTHRADIRSAAASEGDPALLTGIVGAIAAGVDYATPIDWTAAKADAGTIGVVSGAVLVVILAIAYYNGGYVAGRLARFDGARQGFGVWLIGVLVTVVVAGIAALAGSQYDVLNRVDLPSLPIAVHTLTAGGLVALAAAVVVTLLAALVGGKAGQRYHRRIDLSGD